MKTIAQTISPPSPPSQVNSSWNESIEGILYPTPVYILDRAAQ